MRKSDYRGGFTLVEAMVSTAVLTALLAAVVVILNTAVKAIGTAKVRALAAQVAQDRIELAHNVIYDNIGTVGGIPAGTLPQTETITMGGQTFQIQTSVVYIDDKGDEIAPADPIPTDYKRVRVEVTWDGAYSPGQSVVLWTDIAPKGLETMEDAGTLAIMAFDSTGKPVENATVTIVADTTTPPVNMTTYTDSLGMVMLPGAPIGIESYQITVTKSGYTTDRTYGSSEVTNPLNPHATVLEGLLTNVSLAIDRPSTLAIRTVRDITSGYAWFQGVRVKVQGTKEIGRTATDDPVYKYDQDVITGTGGLVNLSNLEWDTYKVLISDGSTVEYAGSNPVLPMVIQPNTNASLTMVVVAASANSYWANILGPDQTQLATASMTMINRGSGEISTKAAGLTGTPDWSQVFFRDLTPGIYDVAASYWGLKTATASVTISGDVRETFVLEQP